MEPEELKELLEEKLKAEIAPLVASNKELYAKHDTLETRFAGMDTTLQLMAASVDRLTEVIEQGNGYTSRLVKLETKQENGTESLRECQKRSGARWKILLGALVAIVTGMVIYHLTRGSGK